MSQLRYWTARFKLIARPSTGLALLSLGVVGGFVWTALQYPDLFSFVGDNLSPEEAETAAIAADIDSSNLFPFGETSETAPATTNAQENPNSGKAEGPKSTPQTSLLASMSFPILGGGPINPQNMAQNLNAIGSSPTLVNAVDVTQGARESGVRESGVRESGRTRSIAQSLSQLTIQSDPPLSSSNLPSTWQQFPQSPTEGTTAMPNSSLQGLLQNGLLQNGLPSQGMQNFSSGNGLPNWTPPTQGTTGLPTNIPVNPAATPIYSNNAYSHLTNPANLPMDSGVAAPVQGSPIVPATLPSNLPSNLPGSGNSFPVSDMPVQPIPEQVFTAPRPLPGRVIGGGNINTFSNP